MNKKNIKFNLILLFFFLFITTGCTADYTLEIVDDKIYETLTLTEANDKLSMKNKAEYTFKDYMKHYVDDSKIPVSKDNIYGDQDNICHDTSNTQCVTYNSKKLDNLEDGIGFKLYHTFDKEDYKDSSILNEMGPSYSIEIKDNILTIKSIDNEEWAILSKYDNLDKFTLNIKTNYRVIESNANIKKNGVYTWTADGDNYAKFSRINIVLDLDNKVEYVDQEEANKTLLIILITLAAIGIIIFIVLRIKKRRLNKI